jgi:hypothetical protein
LRNTFRKHPKIKIKERVINHRNPWLTLGAPNGGPGYNIVPNNTIYLNGIKKEKEAIEVLVHEITHWAMSGYLTEDEVIDSLFDSINWMLSKAPRPLTEKVANFMAGIQE